MEKTKILEFNNVSFSYIIDNEDGSQVTCKVLENFNLDIYEGEFVSILGHNGSGKSTVAKLTNGILFPQSGNVKVCGQETVDDETIFDVRKNVGMVFQDPDNQIVSSVVEEDVAFGVENLGIEPSKCRKLVDEALKKVNMYDRRLSSTSKLSGGQKQRVAIAGIIAMKPKCIVLDEPTAMLDPCGRKDVINIMKDLNQNYGITIVLITHNMDEAAMSDRVVVMNDGIIEFDDSPRKVFSNFEKLKSIGLDVPQSTELVHKLGYDCVTLNPKECSEFLLKELF